MTLVILLLVLLAAPASVAVANAILNRQAGRHPHSTPFQAGVIAAAVWGPVWMLVSTGLFGRDLGSTAWCFAYGAIYYACIVFLNWFIFTITDVSMHIQLLMQIYYQGKVTQAGLQELYNKSVILGNRIPRLLELGQLRVVDGKLHVRGRSVLFGAFVCAIIRRVLGLPVRPELANHDDS